MKIKFSCLKIVNMFKKCSCQIVLEQLFNTKLDARSVSWPTEQKGRRAKPCGRGRENCANSVCRLHPSRRSRGAIWILTKISLFYFCEVISGPRRYCRKIWSLVLLGCNPCIIRHNGSTGCHSDTRAALPPFLQSDLVSWLGNPIQAGCVK